MAYRTYRLYGKALNKWYSEHEKYGKVMTQIELAYTEFDAETDEIVAVGSEDFSTERYHKLSQKFLFTWDGLRYNKGGKRWFEDCGMVTYNKADSKLVKEHFKKLYKAVLVELR